MPRVNRHFEKLAAAFASAGVGEADLPFASTAYMGAAESACTLCSHPIVHQFLLSFARPTGETVEFFPVGSTCIKVWMKAMPASAERTAALANVSAAERLMRKQQKVLKAFTDEDDHDAANLMRIFFRLPPAVQSDKDEALGDIGQRVTRFKKFSSDGQRRYFASLVRAAAREHGVDASGLPGSGRQPAQSAPQTYDDPQDADAMDAWNALSADTRANAQGAARDIAGKVERSGRFSSSKQRGFFAKLVKDAERYVRWMALPETARTAGGPLTDMGGKLEQWGSLYSDRQRSYFTSLLTRAEADSAPAPDTAAPAEEDEGRTPPPPPPGNDPQPLVGASLFSDGPEDDDEDYEDPF